MNPIVTVLRKLVAVGTCCLLFGSVASAGTEKVLHEFAIADGENPYDGVIFDAAGNLYGTTFYGGSLLEAGVVFKLAPAAGGRWTESAIYTFQGGADGSHPYSPLVFDAAGNLYGASYGAYSGIGSGMGTVFKLTPNNDNSWSFTLLHSFTGGKDGAQPNASLVLDLAGDLYGTTHSGGKYGAGIAFELTPTTAGQWKETVLHTFTGGQDGSAPFGLTSDPDGNLYGVTTFGGMESCSCGVVFELSKTVSGWKETVLHSFAGEADGAFPQSLVFIAAGNLYGAAESGGKTNYCYGGCGVVFELTPKVRGETVLREFNGTDGVGPRGLFFDNRNGNLYGSTYASALGAGLIFRLVSDHDWAETVLYDFNASFVNGSEPVGPLTIDQAGNVYGTTFLGGSSDVGVVFEVSP